MKKDIRTSRYKKINTIFETDNIFLGNDEYYHYLYKIKNNVNDKIYIGIHSTKNLNDNYNGSGYALNKAYNKYGINNFTKYILEFFNSIDDLSDKEAEIVTDEFINDENTYNLCVGGKNNLLNHVIVVNPLTEEKSVVNKNDERYINGELIHINSGARNNRYGTHHTEEHKLYMHDIMKGKLSGKESPYYGKKRSKEICNKISESKKGKICVNKDGHNKYIHKDLLETYLANGYKKGRKI